MSDKFSDDAERLIARLKDYLGRDLTPEEIKLLKLSVPVVSPIPLEEPTGKKKSKAL